MAAPLPSGPDRSFWWALVILLSLVNLACAAPYLPDGFQQSKQHSPLDFVSPLKGGMIGPLFRPNDHTSVDLKAVGCFYQFNHYEEGDRIVTNEPCLNCTCHNSMLMCYLKVCPFSKPIGLDCKIEKSPEQCCPVITCPQVPVNLQVMHMTTSTTTASPAMQMTGIVPYVEHGCTMEGDYYPDGAQASLKSNVYVYEEAHMFKLLYYPECAFLSLSSKDYMFA
ncbi:hypothetical protein FHG87_006473 [Trinorchestia longiramus]|nr:hypothetical protein FHG87_006473 [Trinorchestia longiramus]